MIVFKNIRQAKKAFQKNKIINIIKPYKLNLLYQNQCFTSQQKSINDLQNHANNPLRKPKTPLTVQEQLFQYASKLSFKTIQEQQEKQNKPEQQKQVFIREFYDVFNRANQYDFMSFLKQQRNKLHYITGSEFLMVASTVQYPQNVVQILSLIYSSINQLSSKQIETFFQKILAFKPRIKPNIPKARQLDGIESMLVVLSQIYPNDSLIEWLKYVPVYGGNNLYILCIGAFSIMQKLSKQAKKKHAQLLNKIQYKVELMFLEQYSFDLKLGVCILALQMNIYPLSMKLLHQISDIINQEVKDSDPYKLFLLFIALSKHKLILGKQLNTQSLKDLKHVYQGVQKYQEQQRQLQFVKQAQNKIMVSLNTLAWQNMIKINILIELWAIIKNQNIENSDKKQHQWRKFSSKVQNVTASANSIYMLKKCTDSELVEFVKIMDLHKMNNQKLLKNLLFIIAGRLQEMDKKLLISLVKSLVTYVRQCQSYLMDVYKIIIERRASFTDLQIQQINNAFARVQVLFPRKIQ